MPMIQTIDAGDLDTISVPEFRARFKEWLDHHYPPEWRKPIVLRLRGEHEKRWLRLLNKHGWRLPAWPREHGGLGLPLAKQLVYHEELARFGAARFLDSGGTMLGPILIKFGTQTQQEKYLPPILRGETLWCQGYSEPNAGSDLASLKTTAVREGDQYVVNGSKIWTTMAMDASHMFLLARTEQGLRKQLGISFFLMEMATPGVTVRPIKNLAGESEFGQVFFDDARIPAENLVGVEGEGWSIAKALLGIERIFVGSPSLPRDAFAVFCQVADQLRLSGGSFDALNAGLFCDLNDMIALYEMVSKAAVAGTAEDHDYSLLKLAASELFQRISEANMQIASDYAGILGPSEIGALQLELHNIYMLARAATIYSGTSEVQRDIVARALFGKAG